LTERGTGQFTTLSTLETSAWRPEQSITWPRKETEVETITDFFVLRYKPLAQQASKIFRTLRSCLSKEFAQHNAIINEHIANFSQTDLQGSGHILLMNRWGILETHQHHHPIESAHWGIHYKKMAVIRVDSRLEE
jgi:hypothetical protein